MEPFIRSEPIPEVNDEPVKVVVSDSLENMVFKSGKNGMYLNPLSFFIFSSVASAELIILSHVMIYFFLREGDYFVLEVLSLQFCLDGSHMFPFLWACFLAH